METFFIHLLKSSGLLLLFLVIYHAFLKKETFFTGNRLFLAGGLLTSVLLPLITISNTVYVERAPITTTDFNIIPSLTSQVLPDKTFDWTIVFFLIYLMGVTYFSIRLLLQLRSIAKIKRKSEIFREDSFYHVKTTSKISPFSFFKHIFYYPFQFTDHELQTILIHEKEHAKGLHSLDILLTEITCILQWFNPAIWLYKTIVKQNLEFLADAKTCELYQDKKQYQYLMLKQLVDHQKITIVNPFFNSLIKKRIVMLNQNQSKRINALKLLVVLPLLVLFLLGFNTKEVIKFKESKTISTSNILPSTAFISPMNQADIEKISSTFGPAKSPFSNQMEFHTGIDLVAPVGKNVMASANGTVRTSSSDDNNGNHIIIEHDSGYRTKYLHLEDRTVKVGDKVLSGATIGHVGNTGKSTGPHLHFEVVKSGKAVNPESIIPFKVQQKRTQTKKPVKNKKQDSYKTLELLINKDTSNEDLEKMKARLAKKAIDFSYTVVHNTNDEIIDITLNINGKSSEGKKFNGNYSISSEDPIKPIIVIYDDEANTISFNNTNGKNIHILKDTDNEVNVWSGMDEIGEHEDIVIKHGNGSKSVWISKDTDDMETVEIKTENGVKKIFIDGEEVDGEIYKNHFSFSADDEDHDVRVKVISKDGKKKHKKHKVKKYKKNGENVFILKDLDEDAEYEDTMIFLGSDESDNGSKKVEIKTMGKDPLYIIDGKEVSKKEFKKLSPDDIATINVYKGEKASEKYGEKAKDGVVEVVTKDKE